ncbi:MAG: phosphoribosylanthranilate isomerase [Verrucomicrobiae bacterium]|nr:phosphoribosylanthranilate isomerase [Verrucomicrobiae bacterium]NNJ43122.1 phosphoribosylanthranilate isomerase [Akkermansiaceae bacterium]
MNSFLDPTQTSLKICGVTRAEDAAQLVDLGVQALGVNFWPASRRFIAPDDATPLLLACQNQLVRVGVFVNADPELPRRLLEEGLIDLAQFHGDESPAYCAPFADAKLPFIKAIGVSNAKSLANITDYAATAILLDTPAPGVYGGTGEKFDWTHARAFIDAHPDIPVLLAGGITPDNAAQAIDQVHPAALDIASGAELTPGVKDFDKVQSLLDALT